MFNFKNGIPIFILNLQPENIMVSMHRVPHTTSNKIWANGSRINALRVLWIRFSIDREPHPTSTPLGDPYQVHRFQHPTNLRCIEKLEWEVGDPQVHRFFQNDNPKSIDFGGGVGQTSLPTKSQPFHLLSIVVATSVFCDSVFFQLGV